MTKKTFCMMTAAVSLLLAGCISYDYEGKSETPVRAAKDIRIYNAASDIDESYDVLGTATVSGYTQDVSRDRMIAKLRSEAHECGASAILIVEQQIISVNSDSGNQPFTTAFDYDDTSNSWSQLYRDVDQNYSNTRRTKHRFVTPGATRRIIRAEFIRYKSAGKPETVAKSEKK